MTHALIAEKYREACMAELSALTPGNVHILADGHGMVVQDFIKSADASMGPISKPDFCVGQRIFQALTATWNVVGCNTNLGIILLASPMIQAYLDHGALNKYTINQVLESLTVEDATGAYAAIQQASPAGLGDVAAHDVKNPPTITLLKAMELTSDKDLVARQYANGYQEIWGLGLETYHCFLKNWERPAWSLSAVYLAFLANFLDSHLVRKYNESVAREVQDEAKIHFAAFTALDNPKLYMPQLLAWDLDLKSRKLNPGTSADLTVATILADELSNISNQTEKHL